MLAILLAAETERQPQARGSSRLGSEIFVLLKLGSVSNSLGHYQKAFKWSASGIRGRAHEILEDRINTLSVTFPIRRNLSIRHQSFRVGGEKLVIANRVVDD